MTGYTTTHESRVARVCVRFRVPPLTSPKREWASRGDDLESQATLRPIQRRRSRSCQASRCCLSEQGNCEDERLHPIAVVRGPEVALCSVVAGAASSRSWWFSPC